MTWLLAFVALFVTDVAWALYVDQVKEGNALGASMWSLALFVVGALAVIGYTSDPWLLAPSAAGAFCGTYAGVRWAARQKLAAEFAELDRVKAVLVAAL